RQKPASDRLTLFYLILSLGGALGGLFVALIAPRIFDGPWEFHLTLLISTVLVALKTKSALERRFTLPSEWPLSILTGALVLMVVVPLARDYSAHKRGLVTSVRNFYGTLSVHEHAQGKKSWHRTLKHGGVIHGAQLMSPERRKDAVSYYEPGSGIWAAFKA